MSIDLMTQVWKSDAYDGGTLLVLLALADWADDDGGSIFPKVATVGKKARLCPRQVQNCFAQLRKDGVLIEVSRARRGRGTEYRLDIERVKNLPRNNCAAKTSGETGFQKGVKPIADVGVKPIAPPIREPSTEPSMNRHSQPAGAGEGEKIASLGKGTPERFPEFRSAWAETMPDGFPKDDERQALSEFSRITRVNEPELLIACARAHCAAEKSRSQRRRDGDFRTKKPSTWLRDGGWEGYAAQVAEEQQREGVRAVALVKVRQALGPDVIELLRDRHMHDNAMAALDGLTLERGQPPILLCSSPAQSVLLNNHIFALERLLGEGLKIIPVQSGRRA